MLHKFRRNSIFIIFILFMWLFFNTINVMADVGTSVTPVLITSPGNSSVIDIPLILLSGEGQPNSELDIMFDYSSVSSHVDSNGNWQYVFQSVSPGHHEITVIQTSGNNITKARIAVDITGLSKGIELTDPKHVLTVTQSSPTITGTAAPNVKVTLSINSKDYIGYSDNNGNWSVKITDKLPNKQYVLTLLEQTSGASKQSSTNLTVNAPVSSIEGSDKYDTSIKFSQLAYKVASTVIIANGDSYADALCVVPLAKYNNAPILLVNNKEKKLSDALLKEISRLDATHAIIIGGIGAVPQEIQDELIQRQISVERIGGADRYETSYLIAKKLPSSKTIAIVTGENYADALSISPAAGYRGIPIILNPYGSESTYVSRYITENNVSTTYILGSEGVLSKNAVKNMPNVIRIGGRDRYETNQLVLSQFKPIGKKLIVATGEDYPDALIGGAYAAMDDSQLWLVSGILSKDDINAIESTKYDSHILIGNTYQMYMNNNDTK